MFDVNLIELTCSF